MMRTLCTWLLIDAEIVRVNDKDDGARAQQDVEPETRGNDRNPSAGGGLVCDLATASKALP